jgi:hypothetical protein
VPQLPGPPKPISPLPVKDLSGVQGLLSVSNGGNSTGVWGYIGPLAGTPQQTSTPPQNCGVLGQSQGDAIVGLGDQTGVRGVSTNGTGIEGVSTNGWGVSGSSTAGPGVVGTGKDYGVYGRTENGSGIGVRGDTTDGTAGVVGTSSGKGLAGEFFGNVAVNGNITTVNTINVQQDVILAGADCAEQFDVHPATAAEPGTIVVFDDEGMLRESYYPYDKRVAGVVSGAGEFRPAIVLDRRASSEKRISVALVGKVYCKVDADPAPITVGDLITTSARPGFGMKAVDSTRSFGTVVGKALKPVRRGQAMIPILVALQ